MKQVSIFDVGLNDDVTPFIFIGGKRVKQKEKKMRTFEEAILTRVSKKAITDADVEQLAIELKGEILAALRKEMISSMKEGDFFGYGAGEKLMNAFEAKCIQMIEADLGITPKTKKGTK